MIKLTEEQEKIEWIRKGDRLFQNDDGKLNACLGYSPASLFSLAEKYKEAADTLAAAAVKGEVILDRAILPIAFLYRHVLELLIKDIIFTSRRIEEDGNNYPRQHNLEKLWTEAMRLLKKHYGKETPKELDYMQHIIDEFHDHDPLSFSFRYPTDNEGKPTQGNFWIIGLRNFCEVMNRVYSLLCSIAGDLDQKLESMSYMQ
jgi:hypothetical protein